MNTATTVNVFIRRLRDLAAPTGRRPDRHEVGERLATALLLAELARADDKVESSEQAVIERLLAERFGLQREEARALLEKAEARDENAVSLYDYVKSLNERLDYPGRCDIVEMLWRVAWADGHLDRYEEHELRKIAGLLYVSDDDFIRTKLRAMEATA